MKEQGRILFALLALLGASIASAKDSGFTEARNQVSVPWKYSEPFQLPNVTVSVNANVPNPTFFMRLPGGDVLQLPPSATARTTGLTKAQIAGAAYDTRDVLESVARLMLSRTNAVSAVVQNNYAIANVVNPAWLQANKASSFDPLVAALEGELSERPRPLIRERIMKIMTAIKDATYTSAVQAWKDDRKAAKSLVGPWKERGFQVGLRIDIQIGVGKFNFTKNFPIILSFGYNRERRSVVFRRGIRTEKMDSGTAVQFGARVEFRVYSLHSYAGADLDPRPNFSKIHGKSWYPPFLPIVSPVSDYAPGYISRGIGIGVNVQNLIVPQTIFFDAGFAAMNTVLEYEETQREYSKNLDDAPDWMKQFHKKITSTAVTYRTSARAVRCEMLFTPASPYSGAGI